MMQLMATKYQDSTEEEEKPLVSSNRKLYSFIFILGCWGTVPDDAANVDEEQGLHRGRRESHQSVQIENYPALSLFKAVEELFLMMQLMATKYQDSTEEEEKPSVSSNRKLYSFIFILGCLGAVPDDAAHGDEVPGVHRGRRESHQSVQTENYTALSLF